MGITYNVDNVLWANIVSTNHNRIDSIVSYKAFFTNTHSTGSVNQKHKEHLVVTVEVNYLPFSYISFVP